jgi:hypothetical protein
MSSVSITSRPAPRSGKGQERRKRVGALKLAAHTVTLRMRRKRPFGSETPARTPVGVGVPDQRAR